LTVMTCWFQDETGPSLAGIAPACPPRTGAAQPAASRRMVWSLNTGFAITPGMSGHWYNGDLRSGEGFLMDASFNGAGDLIFIVSFYTYDSMGNQAWIVGFGVADGNQVAVSFEFPSGAMWGADFDSDDVAHTPWGTGTLIFASCDAGHISLTPNVDMQGNGFTDLEYEIDRSLLIPGVSCPTPAN
jgi:hypothetical protein